MRINPINIYKTFSFNGQKDPDQPMAPALNMIMHDRDVSQSKKKLLWELSEVPNFYKATKDTPISEFLQLADFIEKQDTNILEMALKGDVRISRKTCPDTFQASSKEFFSLSPFIKRNQAAKANEKISLLDYIKAHPIMQIIEAAKDKHDRYNVYPPMLPYKRLLDIHNGKTIYKEIDIDEDGIKTFFDLKNNGIDFIPQDTLVLFDKRVKGHDDFDYTYTPIDPKSVEPPYPLMPENIKILYGHPSVPREAIKSIYEISENSYFYNLAKNSSPNELLVLAGLNAGTKGLIAKMFRGDITIGVINPEKNEEAKRPVIDTGKLLLEKKQGKITESGIIDILDKHTLAMEVCDLYSMFKKRNSDKEIKYIGFIKDGEKLVQVIETTSGEKMAAVIPDNLQITKKLLSIIEKVPYKKFYINYND